ncbi:putative prefoldin subunit 2 [Yarrowia sp. C11]|nr:putative prefoldin subunit 2 [Yarrowia sp. E02]KAG5369386.1 putative prefoldin subunit 2 [Yarrowia sp. C11]
MSKGPNANADFQNQYNAFKESLQQLSRKIGEIEGESEEHKLVLETLQPMADDRKCFRMIGGVIVEKNVKDVQKDLETNFEQLKKVTDQLMQQYAKVQKEMKEWQVKNNVKVVQQ